MGPFPLPQNRNIKDANIRAVNDGPQLAYREHANCYLVKPLGFAALANTIEIISAFWLDTATLPPTREDQR